MAPVGMEKAPERASLVSKAAEMLERAVPTKNLIDSILANFYAEEQEEKIDWPIDTNHNPKIKTSLSYSKMINEVNHREPRAYSKAGQIEPIPIWGSKTGWHSTNKIYRRSTLE